MLPLTLLLLGAAPPDVCLVTLDGMGAPDGRQLAQRLVRRVLTDAQLTVHEATARCSDTNACVTRAAQAVGAKVGLAITVVTVDVRAFVDLEARAVDTGASLGTATFVLTNGRETESPELAALTQRIRDERARLTPKPTTPAPQGLIEPPPTVTQASPSGALQPRTVVSWVVTGSLALTAGAFAVAGIVASEELESQRTPKMMGFAYSISREQAARLMGTVNVSFNAAWISAALTVVGIGLSTALTLVDLNAR